MVGRAASLGRGARTAASSCAALLAACAWLGCEGAAAVRSAAPNGEHDGVTGRDGGSSGAQLGGGAGGGASSVTAGESGSASSTAGSHGGARAGGEPGSGQTPEDAGPAASGDDAGPAASLDVHRIESPPSYHGSVSNGADCGQLYATHGFEPEAPEGTRHPLFLYFTGTNFVLDPAAFQAQVTPGAEAVTEAMARRGFVALHVEYDNDALAWASDHQGLLSCLFGKANPDNVLAVACALPQVDCEQGIATWGHSLGAFVAHSAAAADARVRAVWTTGYGGDAASSLSVNRLRVVNGENDTTNGTVAVLNGIAGFTTDECPDDGRSQCLRPDGSGWIIVRRADCAASSADHCWFDQASCADGTTMLEPNWIDPASDKAFALATNADWVAVTARTP